MDIQKTEYNPINMTANIIAPPLAQCQNSKLYFLLISMEKIRHYISVRFLFNKRKNI